MDALSFLQSVSGYSQAQGSNQSANQPILLGTVDAAYTGPPNLPRITFDGESTLSGKTYPFVATYTPVPGDRVALAPVGTTYLILGPVAATSAAVAVRGGSLTITGNATVGGTLAVTGNATLGGTLAVTGTATIGGQPFVANEAGSIPVTASPSASTLSFSYVNMPAPATINFTKKFSAAQTKLRATIGVGATLGTANGLGGWAVSANGGADVDVISHWFNLANVHFNLTGWTYLPGLSAGAVTIQGRWRSPHGYSLAVDGNDRQSILVEEVPV